jgi:YegS/Rv2252/BmrU family lipid kinase
MAACDVSLLINPTAGRGSAGRRLPRIVGLLEAASVDADVIESTALGDIEEQARELARGGCREIIVAGGDGSVHEAVNGIASSGGNTALGVIPTGTGNDFAKAASITLDWEAATRLLAQRIVDGAGHRNIDLGRMNDRYFANGAGIGLDAKVTKIARSYHLPIGDLVYLLAIFRTMLHDIATPEIRIESDGLEWDGPLTLANISNGPWIGGMFHIAPMASNDDGQLELLIAAPVSRLRIMRLLPLLMSGEHMREAEIHHSPVRRVRLVASQPVPSHLDGEVQPMQSEFEIEILPGALQLL